jgi:hypothetical protein
MKTSKPVVRWMLATNRGRLLERAYPTRRTCYLYYGRAPGYHAQKVEFRVVERKPTPRQCSDSTLRRVGREQERGR